MAALENWGRENGEVALLFYLAKLRHFAAAQEVCEMASWLQRQRSPELKVLWRPLQ
jgi:hypothetical protein